MRTKRIPVTAALIASAAICAGGVFAQDTEQPAAPDTGQPAPEKTVEDPKPEASKLPEPPTGAGRTATGPNPVPQLLRNLNANDVRVAAAAARSLGVIFSPGGKGGDELPDVTERLIEKLQNDRGNLLRKEAAHALGRIRASSALDTLKETMGDDEIEVALAAGTAVAKILPDDDARSFLTESGAAEGNVKAAAYEGMATIAKPQDAPFLKLGLAAENWRVQTAAVRGLERAVRAGAPMDPEDYDQVATLLGSNMRPPADAAHYFLSNIRNRECVRAAVKAADVRGDGSTEDFTWRLRANAIRTIRRMDYPTNQSALPAVVRNLGDPTANVVNEARNLLEDLKQRHKVHHNSLFPIYIDELEKSELMSQRGAIMAEMRHHVPDTQASRVAKASAKILEESMADTKAWPTRAYALDLLGQSGYTGVVTQIAQCVGDNVPNVRQSAGHALERLAPLCTDEEKTQVTPILHPLVSDPVDWRKTAIAARVAGGYVIGNDLLAPLASLLSHDVTNVRDGASRSLSQVAYGANAELRDQVETLVHAEVGRTKNAWEYGANVLGALRKDSGIDLLTQILGSTNWRAQANAARSVSEIATALRTKIESKPLSDALILAAQSEILQVQEAANQALRDIAKES